MDRLLLTAHVTCFVPGISVIRFFLPLQQVLGIHLLSSYICCKPVGPQERCFNNKNKQIHCKLIHLPFGEEGGKELQSGRSASLSE